LSKSSGVNDQLNANLQINSNRILQKISEEIKDKNNQSENEKNEKNDEMKDESDDSENLNNLNNLFNIKNKNF